MNYSLLKFLEHYFYCDLYKDQKYQGLEFGENFLLSKKFTTKDETKKTFREGTHLIELIRDNQYMLESICKLNTVIKIMLLIIKSDSTTQDFIDLFNCKKTNGKKDKLDSEELKIFHNIMKKILKDSNILPKALIMKYILSTLLDKSPKLKSEYRKIYGVYMLAVFFVIFENKKSKAIIFNILNATNTTWYNQAIMQINSYFSPDKLTDARVLALAINEEEEDCRFYSKSLATLYNFFLIQNNEVKILSGKISNLNKFITDNSSFSTEHFIINNSPSYKTQVKLEENISEYTYDRTFYNKHVNNLFNFIFISKTLNETLSNFWLPTKLEIINTKRINCEYSKMLISEIRYLSDTLKGTVKGIDSCKDDLDLFLSRDFNKIYATFARNILDKVIDKIKS